MDLYEESLVKPELVFLDCDLEDQHALFFMLEERLCDLGYVQRGWGEKIMQRERSYPTGLKTAALDIALPHVYVCVEKPFIAVVRPRCPITFEPMAGHGTCVDARIIFTLGVCGEDRHIDALRRLMAFFSHPKLAQQLMAETSPEAVVSSLVSFFA
ncbi:MAG: PTS sugar transporter subunit IIA [Atopobiaceae bacterium]|jgi:PTS system galactitol-specific IIA component